MAAPLETIVKQLEDTGIIAAGKLQQCLPPISNPKNVEELVAELVKQNHLTKFQAHYVAAGKTKSLILGGYTVIDKIGAGGMGQVYKAEHRRMERIVAIKMLPPALTKDAAAVARFHREVKAAAKLRHTHIVAADDADEANGAHFLVMEYVEGNDLSALVRKNGPFAVFKAVQFILQAARGLEFAHAKGVIHRDIKPANLLLDNDGIVKILDMGLARIESDGGPVQAELTGTGMIMGTVDYMAPEQGMSTKHADARADIYSLGCSLYYLITGKATYDGETVTAKLVAHHNHPIPSLRGANPEVSEELETVFKRMLAKKVTDRYQTMTEVVTDLQKCQSAINAAAASCTVVGMPAAPISGESEKTAVFGDEKTKDLSVAPSASDRPPNNARRAQARGQVPPWKNPKILAGAGAAGFLLLLLAVWVVVRDQDGNEVARVQVPEGGTATLQSRAAPKTTAAPTTSFPPAPPFPLPAPPPTIVKSTPAPVPAVAIDQAPQRAAAGSVTPGPKPPAAKNAPALASATGTAHVLPPTKTLVAASLAQAPVAPRLARAPFDETQAKALQAAWAKYLDTTVETTNSVGATMVLIPPGEFLMGSTDEQIASALRESSRVGIDPRLTALIPTVERPQHRVMISKPFLLAATEVTIRQFKQFATAASYQTEAEKAESGAQAVPVETPVPGQPRPKPPPKIQTYLNPGFALTDDSPAMFITWNDAVAYCNWLSEQEQATYRLPTESEWEYACRAGTQTVFSYGDDYAELNKYAWYRMTSNGPTSAVASKLPNPFGLYDMHGNVLELCQDLWDEKSYAKSPLNDPLGPDSGTARVIRGGVDFYTKVYCRSAHRVAATHNRTGFRCLRLLDVPTASTKFEPALAKDLRLPIPDAAARLAAEQLFRYSRSAELTQAQQPAEKAALANKILQQADATADGPASKYVMQQEAQRLASDAADLVLLHRAVRSRATTYRADAYETWAAMLEKISPRPLAPRQQKELAEAALGPVDELEAGARFGLAERFQKIALAAAQKANDADWIKFVEERGESLADSQQQSAAAQKASAVLAEKPDDPAANLVFGKYLCFVVEEWQAGFEHLAKGSDEKLAELAKLSLAQPQASAAAQAELGDAWWTAAETADAAGKPALQNGARYWYSRSLDGHGGPAIDRISERLRALPVASTRPRKTVAALEFVRGDLVETAPVAKLPTVVCTCEAWLTPSPAESFHTVMSGPYGRLSIQGDKFQFYTFDAAATSPALYQPNQRIHLAGVNNGQQRRLYLDGALVASSTDAGTVNPDTKESPLLIGGDFAGRIEALRISQVARYDKDFIPPTRFVADADTVVLYRFEEGSGDELRDSSGNNVLGTIKKAKWVRVPRANSLLPGRFVIPPPAQ